eukprot:366301-Chlamydomonas_euryale.AAC.46
MCMSILTCGQHRGGHFRRCTAARYVLLHCGVQRRKILQAGAFAYEGRELSHGTQADLSSTHATQYQLARPAALACVIHRFIEMRCFQLCNVSPEIS